MSVRNYLTGGPKNVNYVMLLKKKDLLSNNVRNNSFLRINFEPFKPFQPILNQFEPFWIILNLYGSFE